MIADKMKAMKLNKLPGVVDIPPKLLIKTVEQISIPLVIKRGNVSFSMERSKHLTESHIQLIGLCLHTL